MKWISTHKQFPQIGEFILAIRLPYPSFYWLGIYKGVPEEPEDLFDFWMPITEPPKELQPPPNCS